MNPGNIEDRLALLESRIGRIETQLAIPSWEAAAPAVKEAIAPLQQPETAAPMPVEEPPPQAESAEPRPAAFDSAAPIAFEQPCMAANRSAAALGGANTMEQLIGLKWTGWVGAIVLVIGVALGIQFGYQRHWFGGLPPIGRLAVIFTAGLALIGSGELVMRRVNRLSAAGLFGAGVATLFVGAYAGYAYFDLYSRSISMSLMGISTLIGAAVAMRGNLVSIAVLSLVGANLAPLLVSTENPPILPFLFYLLAMQGVALLLAAWGREGKWWTLRGLALMPAALWMSGVLYSKHGHEIAVLVFMLLYAVLYHGELIVTIIRRGEQTGRRSENAGIAFGLCVTAALTLGLLTYFRSATSDVRAAWVVGLSAISAMLGLGLPRIHPALRRLGIAHRAAAAALLALSIPIAARGVRVEAEWMLLALTFAAAWAASGSLVCRFAAPITWALGLWHLLLTSLGAWDLTGPVGVGDAWLHIQGTPIGSTLILACLLAAAGHAIAVLLITRRHSEESWLTLARVLTAACGLSWIVASIYGLPDLWATIWIVAYAWMLRGFDPIKPVLKMADQAGVVLLIATVKWAVVDALAARLSPDWANTRPVFNLFTGVGVLLAASVSGFYRLQSSTMQGRQLRWPVSAMILFLIAWMGTLEIDRFVERLPMTAAGFNWHTKNAGWTIWWTLLTILWLLIWWRRDREAGAGKSWLFVLPGALELIAMKYVFVDVIFWRLAYSPDSAGMILLNLNTMAAITVLGGLASVYWLPISTADSRKAAGGLAIAVLLACGTLEVDHFFHLAFIAAGLTDAALAEQVGLSIFWSSFAVAALAVGFWRRMTPLRYFALSLLAATLLKVAVIDLSQVSYGYRILSFLGLGLLLLGTSVMYGKVSPILLRQAGSSGQGAKD